jgi:hypothetical protein
MGNKGETFSTSVYVYDPCDPCPSLSAWPTRNLILNGCPVCGHPGDPVKTARVLRGRRVVELPVVEEL